MQARLKRLAQPSASSFEIDQHLHSIPIPPSLIVGNLSPPYIADVAQFEPARRM